VLWHTMYNSLKERGHHSSFMVDAIAAIDIALWDIVGKQYKQPVYRLLGGGFQNPIPLYHSGLNGATMAEKVTSAKKVVANGYRAIKLYIGHGVEQDVAFIQEI